MTEREEWLNSLKVGSVVAYKNRPIGGFMSREMGWRVYVVKYITPKRTRIDVAGQDNLALAITSTCMGDLRPVTPEILESIQLDSNRIQARNKAERLVATLQKAISDAPNILNEPEIYASMVKLLQSLPKSKE